MAVSGAAAAASPSPTDLAGYERFRHRLEADLAAAQRIRDQLRRKEGLHKLTTLAPLGAGVHAQAAVEDTSRIFVHVKLGFRPELALDEARVAAAERRRYLRSKVEARSGEMAGILAHLRLVEQALADLAGLAQQAQRGEAG